MTKRKFYERYPCFRASHLFIERYDTHVPNAWAQENRFLSRRRNRRYPTYLRRGRPTGAILGGPPRAYDCYWRAWELAFGNLKHPTAENDFVSNYCDTAFNGNLFMWDSSFVTCFGGYGRRAFDFQKTLDNFYRKQHPDGFICREISETDGQDTFHRFDPSSTGPNVLAWAEWNDYLKTGDRQTAGSGLSAPGGLPPMDAHLSHLAGWLVLVDRLGLRDGQPAPGRECRPSRLGARPHDLGGRDLPGHFIGKDPAPDGRCAGAENGWRTC